MAMTPGTDLMECPHIKPHSPKLVDSFERTPLLNFKLIQPLPTCISIRSSNRHLLLNVSETETPVFPWRPVPPLNGPISASDSSTHRAAWVQNLGVILNGSLSIRPTHTPFTSSSFSLCFENHLEPDYCFQHNHHQSVRGPRHGSAVRKRTPNCPLLAHRLNMFLSPLSCFPMLPNRPSTLPPPWAFPAHVAGACLARGLYCDCFPSRRRGLWCPRREP